MHMYTRKYAHVCVVVGHSCGRRPRYNSVLLLMKKDQKHVCNIGWRSSGVKKTLPAGSAHDLVSTSAANKDTDLPKNDVRNHAKSHKSVVSTRFRMNILLRV